MAFDFELARFIPFRDREACARVRAIRRADLVNHPNPDFRVRVIEDADRFFVSFALDLVGRIRAAAEEGRHFVVILPAGPMVQYDHAAAIINRLRIPLGHVHSFNMDEFADHEGQSAPAEWRGSFQYAMWRRFFGRIDEDLRPPVAQIHSPRRPMSPTTAAGSPTWEAPMCATGASAGAATWPSGRRTWAMSSPASSSTARPGRAWSSCTR